MGKPYIVPNSWTQTPSQASGATYAITLPSDIVAGDYIGVWIVQDMTGGTTITESGGSAFTFLGTQSTTGALRTAYCFDPAATGGGSDVLTVACNSATIWAVSWLVRGHHATQPHGASPASGTDFVYSVAATVGTTGLQAGVMTTTDANTLNMYLVGMDSASLFRCAANEAIFPIVNSQAYLTGGVGYNPATSTTAVRPTFYGAPSTEGIQILSIAIRWDGATDCGQPFCASNLVELDWLSAISANNPNMNPTWGAIDSTTIDELATSVASTVTLADAALANPDTGVAFETVKGMVNTTSLADNWVGRKLTFGAAKDLTNHILNLAYMTPHVSNIAHVGAKGIAIRLTDGTNWVAYTIELKSGFTPGALKNVQIELGVATELDSSGTVATCLAGVTDVEFLWHRTGSVPTIGNFNFSNLVAFDRDTPATVRGGGAASPASATIYAEAMKSFNQFRLVGLQSEAQIMARGSLQIGDGTNATYWDSLAGALAWPMPYNGASQNFWRVADNKVGLYDNAISGDTVKLRAGSVVAPGKQIFSAGASASAAAARDFGGQVFIGMSPTFLAGETYSSMAISRCGPVNTKGATLNSCSVLNTTASASEAAVVVDGSGSTIDGCTVDVTGTSAGYHLELGTAVTAIALTDVTFSGTPGTDKVHVLKTTGTVTITISGTTTLAAGDVTTAGATVDIAAPSPTLDATVLSGSRVVLYNDTTAAELDNTAPAGTSWSKVITSGASSGDTLTLYVFKEGYEEFSTSFIYAGIDNTLLVSQSVHAAIASLRTELGITDYTTITEFALDITGTVEIDADDADGNTMKARLAIWYNGVLTTENGARYLRGAISILSTAAIRINVSVLDLLVENISVTYGLNFTDTDRRLYRSDGTPIYAAASAAGSIQNDYSGVPDTVTTSDQSLNLATAEQAIDNKLSSISSGVWAYVVTGSTTAVQMMRGFAAMLLGKVSGAGTTTEVFRDISDTKDVATFTVDSSGNRTAVTRDLT